MEGDLWLDEAFDSGVPDCPGTRFVVDLIIPPMQLDAGSLDKVSSQINSGSHQLTRLEIVSLLIDETEAEPDELPIELSVLFVDDDLVVLRKLFSRAIKRAAPVWDVKEVGSGEAALELVDLHHFDLKMVSEKRFSKHTPNVFLLFVIIY
jgi:hypothetical protein